MIHIVKETFYINVNYNVKVAFLHIYDAISVISEDSEELLDKTEAARDELFSIYRTTEKLLTSKAISGVASFDINKRINELLQSEYSTDAYEENLEYYVGLASVTANEDFQQLAQTAEETMKDTIANLKTFWKKYRAFLKFFDRFELKPKNPVIDNT